MSSSFGRDQSACELKAVRKEDGLETYSRAAISMLKWQSLVATRISSKETVIGGSCYIKATLIGSNYSTHMLSYPP